jgi:hypothetical protein
MFKYDAATGTFTPRTTADTPPQANGQVRRRGPQIAKSRDYVFTDQRYSSRWCCDACGSTAAGCRDLTAFAPLIEMRHVLETWFK